MKMLRAALGATIVLSGCANIDPEPSYLGMATGFEPAETSDSRSSPPPAVRHVNSNRVLGAMAFQRTTGANVDPTSLVGAKRAP